MFRVFFIVLFAFLITSTSVFAHKHGAKSLPEEVKITDVSDNIKMLQVGGGNIAVLFGDQGMFVVDNGLSEKNDDVMAAIQSISEQPVRMVVNTHWHYDHTGNNSAFAETGATLIAHNNVRKRLKSGGTIAAFDKVLSPAEVDALPILTYTDNVSVHLNGEKADIIKVPNAHTDGDSIAFWKEANVIHMGDLFFNGFFPFIDSSSGGSLRGMVKVTDEILSMVEGTTKIIPGHGALATKGDLVAYNAMLKNVAGKLKTAKESKKTKEQWIADAPLKELDQAWGSGFLNLDAFTAIVWDAY